MSAMSHIMAIASIELRRLSRTPLTFTLLIVVPLLQLILFGTAIRPNAGTISVVIAAPSATIAASVEKQLRNQSGLNIVQSNLAQGKAAAMVRAHAALIGIEVPMQRSFADPFVQQKPLRVVVDASNAPLIAAAIPKIEAAYWRAVAEHAPDSAVGPGLTIERLYNPDLRADWTFLPALIGVTVMISMIMLGCLSVAKERETGTWQALLGLPVSGVSMMIGKLLPYTLLGMIQGALVLLAGVLMFALPVRGSVGALIALLPLFALSHLVLGYAISVRATTQLAALQGAIGFYLPAMLLSGFLYPFETLPVWAQVIGEAFPLTHFIRAAQGAVLRGDGADAVLQQGLPMVAFLTLFGVLALYLQRNRQL